MNSKDRLNLIYYGFNRVFIKNGIKMDIKFFPNSEIGIYCIGNDWNNFFRDLYEEISLFELIRTGWEEIAITRDNDLNVIL